MPENKEITLQELNERLTILEARFEKLKNWSDLNDYWLQEPIDGLTESVNKLMGLTEEEVGGPYHSEYRPVQI